MKKTLTLFLLILISSYAFSQETAKKERILYIIDKVPVINDPDENTGNITNDDIEELTVVTDKEKIKLAGYNDDKIIYVTTKEYKKRSSNPK